GAGGAHPVDRLASSVAARRRRPRAVRRRAVLRLRPRLSSDSVDRPQGAGRLRDRDEPLVELSLHTLRSRRVRAPRPAAQPGLLLARGLRAPPLPARRRPDQRRLQLRRRALPHRHSEGRRPGLGGRHARARLQLRLQPVVRVPPALGLPARADREPALRRRRGGRTACLTRPPLLARHPPPYANGDPPPPPPPPPPRPPLP